MKLEEMKDTTYHGMCEAHDGPHNERPECRRWKRTFDPAPRERRETALARDPELASGRVGDDTLSALIAQAEADGRWATFVALRELQATRLADGITDAEIAAGALGPVMPAPIPIVYDPRGPTE